MSDLPLVSILVPMYNHAFYIDTCLDSLLGEDYPVLEVIVMDDGSQDDSFAQAEAWRSKHPDAFCNFELHRQENKGIPRTLNKLVLLAKGQFVASDDYLLKGGIRARVEALCHNPQWRAVFADCIVVDELGEKVAESALEGLYQANKRALLDVRFIAAELAIRWCVPGPVFMARRDVYSPAEVGPYDESLTIEDRDFYLRLIAKNLLGFVDVPVAAYRIHRNNAHRSLGLSAAYLSDMHNTEARHLASFRGLAKLGMWLRARNYLTTLSLMEGRPLQERILARTRSLPRLLDAVYRLHSLHVHLRQRSKRS